MAGRIRTTKKLSQRIDREYFKRLYPIPRWWRILSLLFVAVGLGWIAWSSVARSGGAFNAGPLARSHHLLSKNCAICHAAAATFGSKVTEQACVTCHAGPAHKEQQTFAPTCMS